jgi:glycerol uptake facilitator-like aquaporin
MYSYLIEFFGTLFFVFMFLSNGNPIVIGASYALLLILLKDNATGYYNPAITVAMAYQKKISKENVIPFLVSQFFGAFIAFELYKHSGI